MPHQKPSLLIGVSARIYQPQEPVLDLGGVWTRTLHYLEQSAAAWLMRGGALPVMIPAVESASLAQRDELHLGHYAQALDGLLLQGGNDVSPQSYGEAPLQPQWQGDAVRDRYEMELIQAFIAAGKPVFGICRGMQLLNVAFGGSLHQDLPSQLGTGARHQSQAAYEKNFHALHIEPDGWLASVYPRMRDWRVNSIHHQGVKRLAPGFRIEARCPDDGLIEAISRTAGPGFVAGVQWHPEFHAASERPVFDDHPILRDFLRACRSARR